MMDSVLISLSLLISTVFNIVLVGFLFSTLSINKELAIEFEELDHMYNHLKKEHKE